MDDFLSQTPHRLPTPQRPLLGLTVLVVEDSRFACDALRLLCLRSGARIRRADCIASARRHLQVYRPCVAIIDMGLPDGNGASLISELAVAIPRIDVILATSGDTAFEETARQAGADGFLAKPLDNLATFQTAILDKLPRDRRPVGPRALFDETVRPDPVADHDDLCHAMDTLSGDGRGEAIDYVAGFLSGIALSARDQPLHKAAETVARGRANGRMLNADLLRLTQVLKKRLAEPVPV
ncbi:response regulator [Shimia aestuarii]|uniref:response regulator n=1 Tax=Shimia aestuarii TaxID=254406 RepID=UPI001FB22C41|nr:response regulator [Shimia aestuarii]